MDILVSCEWLSSQLDAGDVIVLDASAHLPGADRDPAAEFNERHIEGARFLGLPSLKDESSTVSAALPRADQFSARLRALGIAPSDRVILYDNSTLRSSARAFFIFKMFGFVQVALLDGGFARWQYLDLPVSSGTHDVIASQYQTACDDRSRVRSKAEILANLDTGIEQIVDARDAGRFSAEIADAVHRLAGGHIPGACNLHFAQLFQDSGTFKTIADLRGVFASAGVDLDRPVTGSCGSGMTASVVLFALELLGRKGALYDGSWSEWGADPDMPKEQGAGKQVLAR